MSIRVPSSTKLARYVVAGVKLIVSRFSYLLALFLALYLVFIFNSQSIYINNFKNTVLNLSVEIQEIISIPFTTVNGFIDKAKEFFYLDEVHKLRDENAALKEENQKLLILASENNKLKELLNTSIDIKYRSVSTSLVRSSLDYEKRSFIINAGEISKITPGSVVISGNNLIGKVIVVTASYSVVQLTVNRNVKTPVISTNSREKGVVSGNFASTNLFSIVYCSDLDKIIDGELAVTSGDGLIYPYGLIVGKVHKKENAIEIVPNFDIKDIEYVMVLIKE